jgi:hypothetical protein
MGKTWLKYAYLRENPNYIIYNDGRLFSVKSGKFLVPNVAQGGYLQYGLYINGKIKQYKIHRLVAEYFIKNPDSTKYYEVNHIDGDKTNNHVDNLEWCDRKYNTYYSKTWENANLANQIRIAKCDVKTHEILEIYDSIRIASKANNCSEQNIGQVLRGKQLSAKGYYWKKVN